MKERYHKLKHRFIEEGIHVIDLTKSNYNSDLFITKIILIQMGLKYLQKKSKEYCQNFKI